MRAVDIIIKKRDHGVLTRDEINFFVAGYTRGDIPDYQAASFAMAVLLNGMTDQETTDLTLAMALSGVMLDLSDTVGVVVDKHSSGGVGDKTTLSVLPMVAACGLPVGKMSGRGLGFSGGTLDKLESIPGFRVNLTTDEFKKQLKEIGVVLTGQSLDLAPADGKLYALRDVTGTVDSIPLIASSIMCKKLAGGAHAIVLDVKVGNGAFMTDLEKARHLATLMTSIGRLAGREVVTLLGDMNQPLGMAVGNALELREAVETLQGKGGEEYTEHCLVVGTHMLILGKLAANEQEARAMLEKSIVSGAAFEKFRQLVTAQGGDVSVIDDLNQLPAAPVRVDVLAEQTGWLAGLHARTIGEASVVLGAGRAKKTDSIDHSVGFVFHKKVGDAIEKGQPLCTIHATSREAARVAGESIRAACQYSESPVQPLPHFHI